MDSNSKTKKIISQEQDLSSMLANIASSKSQKIFFKEKPQILNIFLTQLTSTTTNLKLKAIISQFFTNLFHKNTSPLPKLNKIVIFEELKILQDEIETDIDKLTLGDKRDALEVLQGYKGTEDKEEKTRLLRVLSNNLRILISILTLKINK